MIVRRTPSPLHPLRERNDRHPLPTMYSAVICGIVP